MIGNNACRMTQQLPALLRRHEVNNLEWLLRDCNVWPAFQADYGSLSGFRSVGELPFHLCAVPWLELIDPSDPGRLNAGEEQLK